MSSVKTVLTYGKHSSEKAYYIARQRTPDEIERGKKPFCGEMVQIDTEIMDARGVDHLSLDKNSFTLVEHETSLTTADFYDDELVRKDYYPEVTKLLKHETGASLVKVRKN